MFQIVKNIDKLLHFQMIAEIYSCIFIIMMIICEKIRFSKCGNKLKTTHLYYFVLFNTISDIFDILFRGSNTLSSSIIIRVSNVIFFLTQIMIVLGAIFFSKDFMQDKKPLKEDKPFILLLIFQGVNISLLIFSQFKDFYYSFDENNVYHRGPFMWLYFSFHFINAIYMFSTIIKRKNYKSTKIRVLNSILILPFIGMIIAFFVSGLGITNICVTFSAMLLFILRQMEETTLCIEQEKEISYMDGKIMLSQMQPHFMFNVLNTILLLCDDDPKEAKAAIYDFSQYLRENFDALSRTEPVIFNEELRHIKKYLSLEKRRFTDRLNVNYDIQDVDFKVPILSIQPIVENAVKHGICRKDEGGTINISTHLNQNFHEIIINDDGVGFDADSINEEKRSGITLVRMRLERDVNALMEIKSIKDKGTTCVIKIPKE